MTQNLDRFLRWLNLHQYSPETIKEYQREIERFYIFLEAQSLQFDRLCMADIEDFMFSIKVSERTRNRTLSALKSFYRFLTSRGILTSDPAKPVKSIRVKKKNPVFLSEKEFHALFDHLNGDQGVVARRDQLLLALLLTTGIRVSEVISISFDHITRDKENRITLEVLRKGQEMDFIYLNTQVSKLFEDFLLERKSVASDSNKVFLSFRNGRLDRTAVYRLVKKYLTQCGIEKNKKGPHILRHTFATTLMKKNISIFKIKELLNHKNIATTEKYLHLVEDDLKEVVEQIAL